MSKTAYQMLSESIYELGDFVEENVSDEDYRELQILSGKINKILKNI